MRSAAPRRTRALGGLELRCSHAGDAVLAELALIARTQRLGDTLVTAPVFLARRIDVAWDEVPDSEWTRA